MSTKLDWQHIATNYRTILNQYLDQQIDPDTFRSYRVEHGIYEQRADGQFLVRIRCIAGEINGEQLGRIAEITRTHNSAFIHATTRQELQIHNLRLQSSPDILDALAEHGLGTYAGGGNCVRNITCSPPFRKTGSRQVFPVVEHARALTQVVLESPYAVGLPRKFKIALSDSTDDNALARYHDLGFVAQLGKDGSHGFTVYLGGGASNRPRAGFTLFDFAPQEKISGITLTALKLFHEYGNRNSKSRARLRHLVDEWGEARTRECFNEIYHSCQADILQFDKIMPPVTSPVITIPLIKGNIPIILAEKLASWACKWNEKIHLSRRQCIQSAPRSPRARTELKQLLLQESIDTDQPEVIRNSLSCTGAGTCRLGICRSQDALIAVQERLSSHKTTDLTSCPPGFEISISGCPNACGHHLSADLGFAGTTARHQGVLYPAYQVFISSATQGTRTLSQPVGKIPARSLPDFVSAYLKCRQHPLSTARLNALLIQFQMSDTVSAPGLNIDWGSNTPFSTDGRKTSECGVGSTFAARNPEYPEIDVYQLKTWMSSSESPVLLDMRESWEKEIADIGGVQIDLDNLANYLRTIPTSKKIVLYCRTGHRSALAQQSIQRVLPQHTIYNLSGGIHAWSRLIDPAIPQYNT